MQEESWYKKGVQMIWSMIHSERLIGAWGSGPALLCRMTASGRSQSFVALRRGQAESDTCRDGTLSALRAPRLSEQQAGFDSQPFTNATRGGIGIRSVERSCGDPLGAFVLGDLCRHRGESLTVTGTLRAPRVAGPGTLPPRPTTASALASGRAGAVSR
jgi:hypothetical protein